MSTPNLYEAKWVQTSHALSSRGYQLTEVIKSVTSPDSRSRSDFVLCSSFVLRRAVLQRVWDECGLADGHTTSVIHLQGQIRWILVAASFFLCPTSAVRHDCPHPPSPPPTRIDSQWEVGSWADNLNDSSVLPVLAGPLFRFFFPRGRLSAWLLLPCASTPSASTVPWRGATHPSTCASLLTDTGRRYGTMRRGQ